MDEQQVMKKQMRSSFNEPITPVETHYGISYKVGKNNLTNKSLEKLSKYIPEIQTLVETIDEFESSANKSPTQN